MRCDIIMDGLEATMDDMAIDYRYSQRQRMSLCHQEVVGTEKLEPALVEYTLDKRRTSDIELILERGA